MRQWHGIASDGMERNWYQPPVTLHAISSCLTASDAETKNLLGFCRRSCWHWCLGLCRIQVREAADSEWTTEGRREGTSWQDLSPLAKATCFLTPLLACQALVPPPEISCSAKLRRLRQTMQVALHTLPCASMDLALSHQGSEVSVIAGLARRHFYV